MEFTIYRAKEDELIQGCLRRDRVAQQRLFDLYSAKMYGICYRYVHDSMQAEDILVTAFTRIFEKINQFKGEGSFEGWIRRIVVNESLAHLRKVRSMLYVETDIESAYHEPDAQKLSTELEAEDLMKMISQLPDGYKIVFNMYAIDGYSHKEIAEHLGISENTSKSQLSRARVFLQKLLSESELPLNKIQHHE